MGHTYTRLWVHLIFSTKDRLPYLREELRESVFAYMGGIVRELNGSAAEINGVEDHVHMLIRLPASLAISKAVEIIKTNSSRWAHERRALHHTFAWQSGYAAFSVSQSQVRPVMRYIAGQAEHHRRVTFQEELTAFLKRARIEYSERHLWK